MRDIELRLTANLDGATKEVAGFRKEYSDLVKAVEKPLRQVNSFKALESNVEQTGRAMREARERVRELGAELVKADNPTRQLQESYRNAGRELQKLERLESVQVAQLSQMGAGLRAAGVDTQNLAREQSRLSAEYAKTLASGRADRALSSAKGSLGADAVRDTQRELSKLREQYGLVKSSGELSARDLGIAQANYRRSVSETLTKLRELRSASATPIRSAASTPIDTARQTFGINQLRNLRSQLTFLTADYQRLTRAGVLSATERSVAENQYRQQVEQTRRSIAALSSSQTSANKSPRSGSGSGLAENITLAGAGLTAIAASAAYLKTTDTAKKMDAQLRLATNSQAEFNEAQRATFEIAQRNQAPLEGVVKLYGQLAPALAQMGRGQKDALNVIDAVTQSLRISGATASETASTVLQFSQALGSGVLRGDEFNSIAENSPRLLRALADGLNVPTGALRQMAAAGKLTADVIVDTLLGQLPKLTEEAKNLPETWGGAFEQLKNQLILSTKQMDDFTGASNSAIGMLHTLTGALAKISSGEFGDFFRSNKQSIGGFNNEISKTLARIRDLTAARAKLSRTNTKDTVLFDWKFYNRAEIDAEVATLNRSIADTEKGKDKLVSTMDGGNTEIARLAEERLDAARVNASKLKDVQTQLITDTKAAIKAQVSAERSANSGLKKAKADQLETQKKYADALSGLNSGSSGDPTYGSAQALKVGAKQALANGDLDGAKKKASAALDVLQKMADAGQNTLGFEGFIKELRGIALAADAIGVTKAEDKLQAVKDKTIDLKAELEKLKIVQITPILSDEAVALIIKQFSDLKIKLGLDMAVPLTVQPTPEQLAVGGQVTSDAAVKFPSASSTQSVDPIVPSATSAQAATASAKKLKYQSGVSNYSQSELNVQVEPVLAEDYYDKLVREVAAHGKLPVTIQPEMPEDSVGKLDIPVKAEVDQQAADAAQSQIASVGEQMRKALVIPVTVVGPGSASAANDTPTVPTLPGFAAGDMVHGPGTGTSDSILARLSNGEFVMKAAAVQHYGPDLLRQINERRLPRFAEGGSVGDRFFPTVPTPSQSLMHQINPPAAEPMGHVSMNVGGETYHLQAPKQDFERLIRNQRIKFGKS